jgi:hypothetical protein
VFSELKIHDKEEVAWKRLKTEGLDKDGLNFARSSLVNAAVVTQREVFIRVDFHSPARVVRRKLQGVGRVVTLLLSILYRSMSGMSQLFCFTRNCYFRLFCVMMTLELKQIFE